MGAEGARVTYPYLSGQWTELKQCDDTFQYGYTCKNDYTILFLRQSIFIYALAFLFTYLT